MNGTIHDCRGMLRLLLRAGLGSIATAGALGSPAMAQYPPPGSTAPPGSIIISRDVPQRPAFAPGQPGTVTTVQTAPVDIIFGATGHVVTILDDDQSAAISSGMESQRNGISAAMQGAYGALDPNLGGANGNAGASSMQGGGLGGTISGAIGAGTSALGSALGSLSSLGKRD